MSFFGAPKRSDRGGGAAKKAKGKGGTVRFWAMKEKGRISREGVIRKSKWGIRRSEFEAPLPRER